MMTLPLPVSVLRALAMRAVVLWALMRTLLAAILLLGARSSAEAAVTVPNPLLVIVLCSVLAIVDVRRRHERMLWANLGCSPAQLTVPFAIVAAAGEVLLSVVRR